MKLIRIVPILCLLGFSVALAQSDSSEPSQGLAQSTIDPTTKLISVDPQTRLAYIAKSSIMLDASLDRIDNLSVDDITKGPQLKSTLPNNSIIECTFDPKENAKLGGTTNKFACDSGNGASDNSDGKGKSTKIKVRYESVKPYTDVITTRLAWALGFGSVYETPIKAVICHGCGPTPRNQKDSVQGTTIFVSPGVDPSSVNSSSGDSGDKDGSVTTALSIEEHMDGTGIADLKATYSHQKGPAPAWYWKELNNTSPREQVDALRLFAAFLVDGDNKAAQNEMICLSKLDNGICQDPFLYVKDFGNTLGSDGISVHPFNVVNWGKHKVWNDEKGNKSQGACIAAIRINAGNGDGLTNPHISEGGRAFLAARLQKFLNNPDKIAALFNAANIIRAKGDNGNVNEWVEAFKLRANKIIDSHCPQTQSWP